MNYGYRYARLSQYAYLDPDAGIAAFSDLGYKNVEFITDRNTQCYAMETDDKIIIAVRGTEVNDSDDIISDLNFFQSKSNTRGNVHRGFYEDANEIWSEVSHYISNESRSDKKICFCGHSLGGAIATILASRLPFRTSVCYTYGSPRVGNRKWTRSQRFAHHRYVNNNDIVPRLPPVWLCFRHYGELHYINYYGKIRKLTIWQKIKDQVRGHLRAWTKRECFDSLRDHSIHCYVRQLRSF